MIRNPQFRSLGKTSQSSPGVSALPSAVTTSAPPAAAVPTRVSFRFPWNSNLQLWLSVTLWITPFAFRSSDFRVISTKRIDLSVPPVSQKSWASFLELITSILGDVASFLRCLTNYRKTIYDPFRFENSVDLVTEDSLEPARHCPTFGPLATLESRFSALRSRLFSRLLQFTLLPCRPAFALRISSFAPCCSRFSNAGALRVAETSPEV